MTEEGKYIYCIIKGSTKKRFGPIGINNQEVSPVHYKDISAVVSPTPVINFDRLDKKELVRHVAIHQQVNEEMMKDCDIVPMTFGIIAPSVSGVLRILERAYLQFKTALKKIEGKVEFAVQVWWDQQRILEELTNINPEIQELKREISSKGDILGMPINPVRGQRGLAERQKEQTSNGVKLKLGKLICRELETQRQIFVNDTHAFLRSSSYDSTLNKLTDEEMIANFSLLIEKNRESELDEKMQELGKKYGGKLRFKYIGPMPPYSFSNINLGFGNFEIIDEARKLLGLGEKAALDEIKNAYHTLSHKYHPDKYGGESETAEKMKKIIEAYRILENYCQSCDEFMGGVKIQKYSLKREDVENSIIIT